MKTTHPLFKKVKILICMFLAFALQGCPGEFGDEDVPENLGTLYNYSGEKLYYDCKYSVEPIEPADILYEPGILEIDQTTGLSTYLPLDEPDVKLNIIIFKQSTVEYYGWDEIKAQGIFDKRYLLDADSLQSLNYKIKYYGY